MVVIELCEYRSGAHGPVPALGRSAEIVDDIGHSISACVSHVHLQSFRTFVVCIRVVATRSRIFYCPSAFGRRKDARIFCCLRGGLFLSLEIGRDYMVRRV